MVIWKGCEEVEKGLIAKLCRLTLTMVIFGGGVIGLSNVFLHKKGVGVENRYVCYGLPTQSLLQEAQADNHNIIEGDSGYLFVSAGTFRNSGIGGA